MYEELDQSQSNISQHLSKLKTANLVESRKDGLQVYYNLKSDNIRELLKLSKEILLDQLDETRQSLTREE
ncbi:ArsR/SmtB family transcription factor [Orenia metallireducens]|uniref:ArsR/SmtB family transcription factor n=1 Tax=Orenia metallireducens TaxID=1413210 RepID=UPI00209BEE49|nr:metalloregulator ArsR/SmtB family transcription factor [Orenia metallireducens]